jgi:hypothetical protein
VLCLLVFFVRAGAELCLQSWVQSWVALEGLDGVEFWFCRIADGGSWLLLPGSFSGQVVTAILHVGSKHGSRMTDSRTVGVAFVVG